MSNRTQGRRMYLRSFGELVTSLWKKKMLWTEGNQNASQQPLCQHFKNVCLLNHERSTSCLPDTEIQVKLTKPIDEPPRPVFIAAPDVRECDGRKPQRRRWRLRKGNFSVRVSCDQEVEQEPGSFPSTRTPGSPRFALTRNLTLGNMGESLYEAS